MSDIERLVRDLRAFDGRAELVRAFRRRIREPLPGVRRAVRARALATLPRRGGLGAWVASARIGAVVRLSGRSVGVRLRGGRNSARRRSDLAAIDRGVVRAPSWGRRAAGSWHDQPVSPGFFTQPAAEIGQWRQACLRAVDDALEVIARG